MALLNIMIGFMGLLIGLIAFLIVVLIEAIFLSKTLAKKWITSKIFWIVFFSNLLSTIVGLLLGLFSWLWDEFIAALKEIFGLSKDFSSDYFMIGGVVFAFLLTLLIEIPFNLLFLHRDFGKRNIISNSIYANMLTYILLGIFLSL